MPAPAGRGCDAPGVRKIVVASAAPCQTRVLAGGLLSGLVWHILCLAPYNSGPLSFARPPRRDGAFCARGSEHNAVKSFAPAAGQRELCISTSTPLVSFVWNRTLAAASLEANRNKKRHMHTCLIPSSVFAKWKFLSAQKSRRRKKKVAGRNKQRAPFSAPNLWLSGLSSFNSGQ